MNQPRDPDAIIATWLDDGPIDLPAETRRAISVGLRTQPRAGRMAILGGSSMSPLNRLAAAAAVLLAVGALSAFVLSNRAGGPGAIPSTSVSSSPPTTASPPSSPGSAPSSTDPLMSTDGWVPFTSTRYGYQIAHPPSWSEELATRDWALATDRGSNLQDGQVDGFLGGPDGGQVRVTGFAANVPTGTSEDAWLTSYYAGGAYCATTPTFVPVTVDGHPGRLDTCFDAQAFVFMEQRVYVFSIWRQGEQPLFRAFLSTVKFPASVPSGSPGPS